MLRPATTVLLMLGVLVGAGHAHDPAFSWAVARIKDGVVRVETTLAGETAMILIGQPSGNAAIPADASVVFAPLNEAIETGQLYEVYDGDDTLLVRRASTVFDGEDAFHLVAEYDLPTSGKLRFRAVFLLTAPPEHRTSLMVFGEGRSAIGGGHLSRENDSVVIDLPPTVPVAAATPIQ